MWNLNYTWWYYILKAIWHIIDMPSNSSEISRLPWCKLRLVSPHTFLNCKKFFCVRLLAVSQKQKWIHLISPWCYIFRLRTLSSFIYAARLFCRITLPACFSGLFWFYQTSYLSAHFSLADLTFCMCFSIAHLGKSQFAPLQLWLFRMYINQVMFQNVVNSVNDATKCLISHWWHYFSALNFWFLGRKIVDLLWLVCSWFLCAIRFCLVSSVWW